MSLYYSSLAQMGETGPKNCLYVKRTIPEPELTAGVFAEYVLVFLGRTSNLINKDHCDALF